MHLDAVKVLAAGAVAPHAVVAIPVNNEAERIGACLDALAAQRDLRGKTFAVLLLLNNCIDATARIVRQRRPSLPFALHVVHRRLAAADAHAGWARRLAMEAAASLLGPSGVILTTDADGRADPGWVAANLAAVDAGADLVCGYIRADRAEHARLPAAVIARGRLEARYDWLLAEIAARLDPVPHDPWPHHRMASGASLAIRIAAYRAIGGLMPLPLGEDRMLAACVADIEGRIRHSLAARVVVSCRLDGRAEGGMATTIRRRAENPHLPCDPALEPVGIALRRAGWRASLRRLHRAGLLASETAWCRLLLLPPDVAERAAACTLFGQAWAAIEAASPLLARRPLEPDELPRHIAVARRVVAALRAAVGMELPLQHVEPITFGPGLVQHAAEAAGGGDEAACGVVAAQRIVGLADPVHQRDVAARLQRPLGKRSHPLEIAG